VGLAHSSCALSQRSSIQTLITHYTLLKLTFSCVKQQH
jgi:hypothetical protein